MKLISKFKDYYDYLIYINGVDNQVVYNRELEKDVTELVNKSNHDVNKDPIYTPVLFTHFRDINYSYKDTEYLVKELYILGDVYIVLDIKEDTKRYLKMANKYDFEIMLEVRHEWERKHRLHYWHGNHFDKILQAWSEGRKTYRDWNDSKYIGPAVGVYSVKQEDILKIHKYYKQPVIGNIYKNSISQQAKLDRYGKTKIIQKQEDKYILTVPNLSIIQGLASILPDIDIYKNIYNFLLNIQNDEKLSIPMDIDNDSKVIEAGFDLKSSFRHPTK